MLQRPFLFSIVMGLVTVFFTLNAYGPTEAAARGAVMAVAVLVLVLTLKALVGLWRLLRRASLDRAAYTAGAMTTRLSRAFKDGRRH
jgi:uncharacterized membrane protein YcjF (UPF0283 family)